MFGLDFTKLCMFLEVAFEMVSVGLYTCGKKHGEIWLGNVMFGNTVNNMFIQI
jgi:hypothetical protein